MSGVEELFGGSVQGLIIVNGRKENYELTL
jgi:hypothetical protein